MSDNATTSDWLVRSRRMGYLLHRQVGLASPSRSPNCWCLLLTLSDRTVVSRLSARTDDIGRDHTCKALRTLSWASQVSPQETYWTHISKSTGLKVFIFFVLFCICNFNVIVFSSLLLPGKHILPRTSPIFLARSYFEYIIIVLKEYFFWIWDFRSLI